MHGARGFRRGGRGFLSEEEKANRPKITVDLLKRIGSYLLPYWKQMVFVLLAIIVSSIFGILPSILTGRIIDDGLYGRNLNVLVILILASLGVTILSNLIGVLQNYLNTWIAQHISFDMRNKMFAHLQSMSHRFFTSNKQGDIITRMTSDISGVQRVVTNTLTSIISNVITLVVALIAMYRMNWLLATVAIVIVPLFTIPTRRVGKTRWKLTRQSQECNDEINGILNETLSVSGQLLVKLFTNEKYEYEKYEKANQRMVKLNIKESLVGRWFGVVINTLTTIGPMLIYFVGGLLMIKYDRDLTVGDISVMVALLSRMYMPVNMLLNIQVEVTRSMALFTRIFEYFDMPVEIKNSPDAITPSSVKGTLKFDNVHFHYIKEKPVLKGISFELKEGKSIAIVGPSGAGKSTIINLIPRIYDVVDGQILLDGMDIRKLDLSFLRKNVGMVTQDTYLFNGTIRDNLLYAKFDATEDEIKKACIKANIHEFIMAQPEGYDTIVGNRGLKLSGGEKQRLSIARVILKDPAILIFDEATSSLDSISENLIQEAIEPLIKQRTSIVIAHRLSTIMAVDEILVISDGHVVEKGTHNELVSRGGIYSELYETQFRRALDDYEQRRNSGGEELDTENRGFGVFDFPSPDLV
ncbi:MAG: ABC transporter ATP-binding protein [Clostridiales bacterium]|nr:ABC transporter ATP-binding protein [Clostridiales bacterium]